MKNHQLTLNEYKCLYAIEGKRNIEHDQGHIGIPISTFEEIRKFVLDNDADGSYFLVPATKKIDGKRQEVLQAQNYVGVIETKNGALIEILPKINQKETFDDSDNLNVRNVFMKMLRRLKKSPFKHFNKAHMKNKKMHLLEIFISMFLEELTVLIQRGLKSDYITKEENTPFLKGKLKIKEHLKYNYIHKERFFVAYDEYQQDRVENRLIKSTLQYLYKKSHNNTNQQLIREFLFVFNDIGFSKNPKNDFTKVKFNRQMKDYGIVLQWCKLFLNNESFTTFKGNNVAFALLFDMNRVFEDYVAYVMKKKYSNLNIRTQGKDHHLIEAPKRFGLKPDIIVNTGEMILDTKWKVIQDKKNISQNDIYQMYAYATKYTNCRTVYLVYPKTKNNPKLKYYFDKNRTKQLRIYFFDCEKN